jgi:hypothetical protein
MRIFILMIFVVLFFSGCTKEFWARKDESIIDNGDGIILKFIDGLNDDPKYQLKKDQNGYYYYTLIKNGNPYQQNIQRITAQILRNSKPVYTVLDGPYIPLTWSNNLFYWSRIGDTVAQITKRYFNPLLGQYQYINLPPLINWQDVILPTINNSSIADQNTGLVNTVIAPISSMVGDTMIVNVSYKHYITQKVNSKDMFVNVSGEYRTFSAQIEIVLK